MLLPACEFSYLLPVVSAQNAPFRHVGKIESGCILLHHPVGIKVGTHGLDGFFHYLHPSQGNAVFGAFIEQGNNGVFEEFVQQPALYLVLIIRIIIIFACTYCPAVFTVICLAPPAIKDTAVNAAICRNLHATGATCLHWPPGGVEPDIHALGQVAGYLYVIVLNKDYVHAKFRKICHLHNSVNQLLAKLVLGVCLATEYELHRPVFIGKYSGEAFQVRKEKGGTLVCGKTSGEPDGKSLRIQDLLCLFKLVFCSAFEIKLFAQAFSCKGNKALPKPLPASPKFKCRHVLNPFPDGMVGRLILPAGAEIALVKPGHFNRQPTYGVDAVCYVGYGYFVPWDLRPDISPHLP